MARDPLAAFVQDMLDAKNMTGIDAEVKEQLESDLKTRLLDQIDRALIDALPEEKVGELNHLLDQQPDQAQIQEFIATSGIDVQRITLETMVHFRNAYVGEATTPAS